MSHLRSRLLAAAWIVGAILVVIFVLWPQRQASWVTIEGAHVLEPGRTWTATVTLLERPEGSHLHLDLHGFNARRKSVGFVAAAPALPIGSAPGAYTLSVVAPSRADLAGVRVVLFASSSDGWPGRTRVVASEPLGLSTAATPGTVELRRIALYSQQRAVAQRESTPLPVRMATATIWCIAGWMLIRRRDRSHFDLRARLPIFACVAIALWELAAPGDRLAEAFRSLSSAEGLYEWRRWPQQLATMALVVASAGTAIALRRGPRTIPALAVSGICAYTIVASASIFSLHEVDAILTVPVGPIQLAAILRLAAGVAVIASAWSGIASRASIANAP